MRRLSPRSAFLLSLFCFFLFGAGSIFWAGNLTYTAVGRLKAGDLEGAASFSHQALPLVTVFSAVTLQQIPDVELWRLSLDLVAQLPEIKQELSQNLTQPTSEPTTHTFKSVANQSLVLGQLYQKTWLIKRLTQAYSAQINQITDDLRTLRDSVLTGQHSFIVVFQNTQELRATGGFTGSYALVQLDQGRLIGLDIFDIYQPDGQFVGYVTAPTGVAEYLSSGRGLRLPDANWWPDFPASAQQMLAFFALGKTNTIGGVVAVNLSMVEKLLKITGPIYVPDYQITVTPDNVAEVLRSNREDFFPGSVAKQHLLSSFVTLFKLKLGDLSVTEQSQIFSSVLSSFATKDIQLFSAQTELQTWLENKHLAGQQLTQLPLQSSPTNLYVFPVESNVGINKANQGISRNMELSLGSTKSHLQITFQNQTRPALPYVNYQRLFVLPSTVVKQITYQGQTISNWHEESITTSTGEQLKQIGFLLTLLPQQTSLASIELEHPALPETATIVWQKQAGVEPYSVTLKDDLSKRQAILDQDQWFTWRVTP